MNGPDSGLAALLALGRVERPEPNLGVRKVGVLLIPVFEKHAVLPRPRVVAREDAGVPLTVVENHLHLPAQVHVR
eukprot:CAMPEP_0180182010 /NCGR_PEP_ID=MMETSP0986-20121125/40427_1 /TAXON_ID=697907 /ORGANISM="non described non described, Strain CCMP2293" /LENGTH=74 /DNA_ID=CAMNT_0022135329 /DNA_START=86 /DNA_END=307 /DNA_ORIENTATION=-